MKHPFTGCISVVFSLHVSLWDVGAVDFDVDLSVFFPLLLLFLERPSVVDEVEGQKEAQHTQSEQSNVDLERQTRELASVFDPCVLNGWICVFIPRTGLLPGVPSWPETVAAAAEQRQH